MVKYRLKDLFNLFAGGDIDIEHFSPLSIAFQYIQTR